MQRLTMLQDYECSVACYILLILTLKQAPIMHHCQTKNETFSGEGHSPLPRLFPHWEGDTPPQTPLSLAPSVPRFSRLRRLAFLFLFIYDSNIVFNLC